MRYTIDEYSKQFKMSKEMIHSKLRAKKLNYTLENDIKYIIVAESGFEEKIAQKNSPLKKQTTIPPNKPKTTVATIISLYQRENQQLKEKITQLEEKIDKLINDKEQMLRDERDKIESLYVSKDEQLKNILELINTKLMMENQTQTIHEVESVHPKSAKNIEHTSKKEEIMELRDYLKTLDLKSYQRKIIKKRFLAVYDSDIRVIQQNGKLYLDFSKYDYSDLLEY